MKVQDLINELKQYDPDLNVVVRGYEGGYNDCSGSGEIKIALDVHTEWYYGSHDDADDYHCKGTEKTEMAVFIA